MARNSHKKKYLRVSIVHGVGVVIMSQRELPCVFHVVPGNALDWCNCERAWCCVCLVEHQSPAVFFVCLVGWCFKEVADELKLPPGLDDVFVYN
jgi:hypothetical protein